MITINLNTAAMKPKAMHEIENILNHFVVNFVDGSFLARISFIKIIKDMIAAGNLMIVIEIHSNGGCRPAYVLSVDMIKVYKSRSWRTENSKCDLGICRIDSSVKMKLCRSSL